MPFVCLFVPDFPVQAVVRAEPELQEKAVAVLEGAFPLTRVIAANEAARDCGIELHMTKLQAEACGVILRNRSLQQEQTAHSALLDCAGSFSPHVEDTAHERRGAACMHEFDDTVVLDISGSEKLFGQPEKIARTLSRRVHELGLKAQVAIVGNPDAAVLAARGFREITVIPPGGESERLGQLPVAALLPGQELLDTMSRWGICTLRQLSALPEVAVVERLGQEGRRWQMLARGTESRPLVPKEPGLKFEEFLELEYPVDLLEPLFFLLNRLLEQICTRLSIRALATNEVRVIFTLEHSNENKDPYYSRVLKLPVAVQKSEILLKLLQLDLQSHPPAAPVLAVQIKAEPVRPRATQSGLFVPKSPEPERLEIILARIRNIVGEENSGSPLLLDTNRPGAFRMVRFVPPEVSQKPEIRADSKGPRTALRVFRPPLPVRVQMHEGAPISVSLRWVRTRVLALAGPWRNTGGWWSDARWTRDEWDVLLQTSSEKQDSTLYRIFQEIRSGQWFVEGSYD